MGNRMYDEFAHLWAQVSAPEDYAEEAEHWRAALDDLLGPAEEGARHHILEQGVGGGNNLSHLTPYFDATAVDLSPQMLENSRRLNPGVEHHVGDMRTVRLGRRFDAVLVHDAISYLLTEDDVLATLETARAHLRSGGVFITGPDWFKGQYDLPHFTHKRGAAGKLSYGMFAHDPDPEDSEIETIFTYHIADPETGYVRVEIDRHRNGIFTLERWLELIAQAGFEPGTRPYPVHDDGRTGYLLTGLLP